MIKPNSSLTNLIILQTGWWGITLSYPHKFIYFGLTLILLTAHFLLNKLKFDEVKFILIGGVVGCCFDYLAINLNIWSPTDAYNFFPSWLICYWLVFLTSFSQSLNWLKNNLLLAGFLGALFGPLSYFAGEKFSILSFNQLGNFNILVSYSVYGLIWFINYIILFKLFGFIKKQNTSLFKKSI